MARLPWAEPGSCGFGGEGPALGVQPTAAFFLDFVTVLTQATDFGQNRPTGSIETYLP